MKNAFLTVFAILIMAAMIGPAAQAAGPVTCYSTWDDTYIFVAVKVDSSNVRGTHSAPNATVTGDDTVTVYLDTNGNASAKIGPGSFAMSVSAAKGCQFMAGSADGKLTPKQSFSFKYATQVLGTINSSSDSDKGYTVEIALPWKLLGVNKAASDAKIGFNVVVREAESQGLLSMSPSVKTEDDALSPSKWSLLELSGNNAPKFTPDRSHVVCPMYGTKAPLVDGELKAMEWVDRYANVIGTGTLETPAPSNPVTPVVEPAKEPVKPVVEPATEPVKPVVETPSVVPPVVVKPEPPISNAIPLPKLVFTHYFYWFQADPDRGIPVENVYSTDGKYVMQDFPNVGLGPWFTYDRVQWHLDQLEQISDAGIDVILPVYRGDKAAMAGYARKGLDCLVSALIQLSEEEKRVPSVGMFLDTFGMQAAYGFKPNLKDEEVRSTLYGMIKNFFERVPVQYRALVQTRKDGPGGLGNIIFLGSTKQFVDVDSSAIEYCNERFRKDFGSNLVWVVDADYTGKIVGYDGVASFGSGSGYEATNGPNVKIASIGPGYNNTSAAADQSKIRYRVDTQSYSRDWDTALKFQPDWVVCDGWINLNKIADIALSTKNDAGAVSITKEAVSKLKGTKEYHAAYDWLDIPGTIQSGQFNVARMTVRNAGTKAWLASDKVAIAYRWYKNGKYFADSGIKILLRKNVQPGESVTTNFGIAPVDESKAALPEGDAVLRLELMRSSDNKWFSDLGDEALMLPVVIGSVRELDISIISDGLPVMVGTGNAYKTHLSIRNQGTKEWPAASSKLVGKLYKVANYTHDNPNPISELVDAQEISIPLPYNCTSGMIVDFDFDLKLVAKDGGALPAWDQTSLWNYRIIFDVVANGTSVSAAAERVCWVTVSIYEDDLGVWILDSKVPEKMTVGKKAKVKVAVRNRSAKTWKPNECSLIAKWYTADGIAVPGQEYKIALKKEIVPEKFDIVNTEVQAPDKNGTYILMWDMVINGKIASKSKIRGRNDISLNYVQVSGG